MVKKTIASNNKGPVETKFPCYWWLFKKTVLALLMASIIPLVLNTGIMYYYASLARRTGELLDPDLIRFISIILLLSGGLVIYIVVIITTSNLVLRLEKDRKNILDLEHQLLQSNRAASSVQISREYAGEAKDALANIH